MPCYAAILENAMNKPEANSKDQNELRGLMQYLIANIGHPIGMGVKPTDEQADTIIELVRRYDSKCDAV